MCVERRKKKRKRERTEKEMPPKQQSGSGVNLTPHIKGCTMYFLKSNYESERNALQVGLGAIYPAHKLFGCLFLSHKIP